MILRQLLSLGFLSLCYLSPFNSQAQRPEFSEEMRFAQYLLDRELFADAQLHFSQLQRFNWPALQSDSLNYLRGYSHYRKQEIPEAMRWLDETAAPDFPALAQSKILLGFLNSYQGFYPKADQILSEVQTPDAVLQALTQWQLMGNSLLMGQLGHFDSLEANLPRTYFAMNDELGNLLAVRSELGSFKKKSPVVAGIMSAILPGSGKVYGKQLGQGVAAFLQCGVLGAQAAEAYFKADDPLKSARFWVFSGLFSVFYIGNIWGSTLSVQAYRKTFYDEQFDQVHISMHIPLRRLMF